MQLEEKSLGCLRCKIYGNFEARGEKNCLGFFFCVFSGGEWKFWENFRSVKGAKKISIANI